MSIRIAPTAPRYVRAQPPTAPVDAGLALLAFGGIPVLMALSADIPQAMRAGSALHAESH